MTRAQRNVLDALHKLIEEHGWPPTIRELCVETGLASPQTVHYHLSRLHVAGWIDRGPGMRKVRITEKGRRLLTASPAHRERGAA